MPSSSAFHKCIRVQVACWLKDSEEGGWHLYVASDQITDENFDVAYGEVGRVARQLHDGWFDSFQVKVLGTDDPLAQAALDLQRRYPKRVPGRFPRESFRGRNYADVYLYAASRPAPVP